MEAKLTELVTRLKAAAEANLKSIVLYGSAVTSEFRAGHSDLNVLCIVERVAAEDLEHLHDASEWWVRQGNPPPHSSRSMNSIVPRTSSPSNCSTSPIT